MSSFTSICMLLLYEWSIHIIFALCFFHNSVFYVVFTNDYYKCCLHSSLNLVSSISRKLFLAKFYFPFRLLRYTTNLINFIDSVLKAFYRFVFLQTFDKNKNRMTAQILIILLTWKTKKNKTNDWGENWKCNVCISILCNKKFCA